MRCARSDIACSSTGLLGVEADEVVGPSGARYQLEAQGVWDAAEGADLRVIVSVDDGGLRAFAPVSDDFIVASDGSFVGE